MKLGRWMMAAGAWPAVAMAQQAEPARAVAQSETPATPSQTTDEGGGSDTGADEEILVTGSRNQPGSVIGDIPPDQVLGPADIRSYGVSSVADLLTELEPQTRSGRGGAPVLLLNGRRISGFQEIRDLPTEAIARVEILPEEVALKYGYRADQRVVNFVLRRRFRAATVELTDRQATEGGRNTPEGELDLLNIQRDRRASLHLEYDQSSPLFESERDILPAASDDPANPGFDQRAYRTLLPSSRNFSANGVYARPFLGTSATINGQIETTDSTGRLGLPVVALSVPAGSPFATGRITRLLDGDGFNPLAQRREGVTAHVGTTLNGDIGRWRWSFTGNYDRDEQRTLTDTGVDTTGYQARLDALDPTADPRGALTPALFGPLTVNRARSISSSAGGDMLVNGTLFQLPAGSVATSVKFGVSTSELDSRSIRLGATQTGSISRDIANAQANIDLPIANRTRGGLSAIGSLSANLNIGVDNLSDFGTLVTLGYGINWSPVEGVRLIGSITDQDEAPTAQQLGAATVVTPNARVFDYVRGTTATVTTISGGNPNLTGDQRHVQKLGLTLKPWTERDLTLTANYVRTSIDDPVRNFPAAVAAIEAVFPDRVIRDGGGQLLRLDARPINFARSERSELRWGINFSKPIRSKIQQQLAAFRAGTGPNPFEGMTPPGGRRPDGAAPPGGAEGARPPSGDGPRGDGPRAGGPGGGGGRGGFGGGGFGGGGRGQGGGRLQFAVYHTLHLTDRVLVADGGPALDLLNGDAISSSGGQPRHEIEGQAGYTNNGLGTRLSVNYLSGTRANGMTSAQDLRFSGLTTANLRMFVDFGGRLDWVRAHPWLRGSRISFSVDNLFNQRQDVTDANGTTPVSYQPDYINSLGRTVRLSVRKLFF
ncbi:TonB-dependent receptor [Sphingomonas sp. Leaf339]|uniref:TonB-dependent receptor n=1 Tax=Sphingomonas sp. Leaf339 TaxID=1736343 RepID=UPI0006F87965|nr:TonB-dependent receptor [Sphingomonas sp. Leaf339]KQU61856.1 TonB-dependent receptor [Sphingomonas sp. Leaf339]